CGALRDLPSFPTRRSSDLGPVLILVVPIAVTVPAVRVDTGVHDHQGVLQEGTPGGQQFIDRLHGGLGAHTFIAVHIVTEPNNGLDRKSTRLNSSHVKISYA